MRPTKQLLYGKDARKKLASGADQLASAVVSTLGPRSRNVALNREYPGPHVVHDGVTVANEIRLKDPFEDMGAVLVREAAFNTNGLVGDGTTTATLLANTLIQEGMKLIDGGIVDGVYGTTVNPMELKDKLLGYADFIGEKLTEMAKQLEKKEEYQQVATISSGNSEIGKLVADAIEKVGKEGVILVEENPSFESTLEFQEGMEFENGYLSPYFVTDPDRMVVEYKDAYVLLTDYTIADAMMLVPVVEKLIKDGNKPLLIVADDVVGAALQALALTKIRQKVPLVAVRAPEYADRRKQMMEDIAVLTGATIISYDLGKKLEDVTIADLGKLRGLRVTQTHTTITPLNPDKEELLERVKSIKEQIGEEKNEFRKGRLEYRLGKLSQSVAIIRVGGASDTEVKEKKERFIDAVHATKAALAEGIVPGGGIALKTIAASFNIDEASKVQKDFSRQLVWQALCEPFNRIMRNSGEDPRKIDDMISTLPDSVKNRGYDVVTQTAGDMYQLGVVDPVKVTKLAVKHAFSVAALVLTTDTLVTDIEDQNIQKVQVA